MHKVIYLLGLCFCVTSFIFAQSQDTVEIFSPDITIINSDVDMLVPISNEEKLILTKKKIEFKRDKDYYYWEHNIQKSIYCSGEVLIYRNAKEKVLNTICLACIEKCKVVKLDGCIEIHNK